MCLLTRLFFNQSSTSVILAKAGIQLRTQDFIGRKLYFKMDSRLRGNDG